MNTSSATNSDATARGRRVRCRLVALFRRFVGRGRPHYRLLRREYSEAWDLEYRDALRALLQASRPTIWERTWGGIVDLKHDMTRQDLNVSLALTVRPRDLELAISLLVRDIQDAESNPLCQLWQHHLLSISSELARAATLPDLGRQLRSADWGERFVARQVLVARGAEVMKPLARTVNATPSLAVWQKEVPRRNLEFIAHWISRNTHSLKSVAICREHLLRWHGDVIYVPGRPYFSRSFTYYCCPICQGSRDPLLVRGKVTAILDAQMRDAYTGDGDELLVNWLKHSTQSLFEFDGVEIRMASDEEMLRLVIRVKENPARARRCRRMVCRVSRRCDLAENSLRNLQSIFRVVERYG